jgi:hypothetical protein
LPPYGAPARFFSADGTGAHREGFVIRFLPQSGEPWVGNFQPGSSGPDTVLEHPEGRHLIAVSKGKGYVVDPEAGALVARLGGDLEHVIPIPSLGTIVFSDGIRFQAIGADGVRWTSPRVSWDGVRNLEVHAVA